MDWYDNVNRILENGSLTEVQALVKDFENIDNGYRSPWFYRVLGQLRAKQKKLVLGG